MNYQIAFTSAAISLLSISTTSAQEIQPAKVLGVMEQVADWQLANPSQHKGTHWAQGAGYTGMMALTGVSGHPKYLHAMMKMGDKNGWQLGPKPYYADDHVVGQAYVELFEKYHDEKMIKPLKKQFDAIMAEPSDGLLTFRVPGNQDRWSWCDALFMAPATWSGLYKVTGNENYLDFMVREWWETSDYLYDEEEHLYYRDSTYFDKREKNDEKVFWGRGNGWVMGGLVRVMQDLPSNHPSLPKFKTQFKEMSAKLLTCQQDDGMWRASLLDPDSYPLKETSSTGFYTYALAWGVNQGLLDRATYQPAVMKAWASLVACVADDGKLTHVQPIGADPQKFPDDATEVYGTGAFLLAGSEIYRMGVLENAQPQVVSVTNSAAFHRIDETVELELKSTAMAPVVMESVSSKILDSQWVDGKLLFKVDLAPGETRLYLVMGSGNFEAIPEAHSRTHARFVPERMDDFAWESDRIAYRMYGPALMTGEGTVSSGVDVWVKSTRKLVIDEWYKGKDYHKDHGEGLDYYKVAYKGGSSRGCGGLGIWDGEKLHAPTNYKSQKVLTNGPIRSEFELTFDSWDAAGRKVSEVKRISIDAGSYFSRVETVFTAEGDEPLQVGVGIAKRKGGKFHKYDWHQLMAYWEPEDKKNGSTGCAVIVPDGLKSFAKDEDNFLAIAETKPGKEFVYWLGAGWSKSGDFDGYQSWLIEAHQKRQRIANPLIIKLL